MKYAWAVNPQKMERAIAQAGVGASEETIKELYIKFAGKLSNDTTIDTEDHQSVEEVKPVTGGSKRSRFSRSK